MEKIFFFTDNEKLRSEIPVWILKQFKPTLNPQIATTVITDKINLNVFVAHDEVKKVIFVGCDKDRLTTFLEGWEDRFPWIKEVIVL